ncbi:MAG: RNA polymerase sigma factor [Candidatus Aureabacteria bacterium]|nr:RNA polymerase sigma factor [Candidatus Auribacterota bacterium]
MEDLELLQDLKDGNPEAFKRLVELHQELVINICYRFVFIREDAEDIAQEVFIKVYRSISDFRGESKLSTWIYRIAVAKSLDFIRRINRRKRFGFIQTLIGIDNQIEKLPAPRSSLPDAEMERRERYRVLQHALGILPENQRMAITLSKYHDFSNKEIAEILGTTVSAVDALLHRAKNNLRKRLYRYYEKLM